MPAESYLSWLAGCLRALIVDHMEPGNAHATSTEIKMPLLMLRKLRHADILTALLTDCPKGMK